MVKKTLLVLGVLCVICTLNQHASSASITNSNTNEFTPYKNNGNDEDDDEDSKNILEKLVNVINELIEAQIKSSIKVFTHIISSLTSLATKLVTKGISLLNKKLSEALNTIADISKNAIVAGIDISVCTAKEHGLYKLISNLAIPMSECINDQVESCFKITYLIEDKVKQVIAKAASAVKSVLECDNLMCKALKVVELNTLYFSIPLDVGQLLIEATQVLVKCNLDGVACSVKASEDFVSNSTPVVEEIVDCIKDKMKSRSNKS